MILAITGAGIVGGFGNSIIGSIGSAGFGAFVILLAGIMTLIQWWIIPLIPLRDEEVVDRAEGNIGSADDLAEDYSIKKWLRWARRY